MVLRAYASQAQDRSVYEFKDFVTQQDIDSTWLTFL